MEIPFNSKPRPDTGLYNAKVGLWLFLASEVMLFGALFSAYILLRVGAPEGTWPHGLLSVPIGTFNTFVLITSSVTVVLSWAALQVGNFSKYKFYQAITILCALGFLGIKSFEYRDKFKHYEVWLKEPVTIKHGNQAVDTHRVLGVIKHEGSYAYFWNRRTLAEKNLESFQLYPDSYHYTLTPKELAKVRSEARGEPAQPALEISTSNVERLSAFIPSHSTFFAVYFTLTGLHGLHVLGGVIVIFYIWGPGAKMWKTDPQRYINRVETSGLFWHFVDLVWIFLFPIIYLL
jgi:cytochrome c oxidase subunit III